ncbi:CynX/NimT family MFS transporter [Chloroflexota bacterium]
MIKSGVRQKQEPLVDKDGTPSYQRRYRWVMLALIWLLYWVFGFVQRSIGPLITPILEDLNISYSQMGLIMGSWPLPYIVIALIGGAIIDRWGIRKSLFVGILIIGLSEILRYFANGFITMFLLVAIFGLGGPMISIGCPKTIAEWFRGKDRGIAAGVYMTGPWAGGIASYAMTNSVVMPLVGYSWRLTFVCYGLLAFGAALLWWFLARDVKSIEATERTSIVEVFRDLIRIRNIQLILIMGFLSFTVTHGFNDWLPKLLETGGLPPAVAGFAASIPLLVGIPAVLLIPPLTPAHLRGRILAFTPFLTAVGLWMVVMTSGVPLVIGLIIYGTAKVVTVPFLMLLLMEMPEVSSRHIGSAAGMFFCIAEIGGFSGPFVMGSLVDLTGDFMLGTIVFVGLSITMAVMALLLKIKPASDIEASP